MSDDDTNDWLTRRRMLRGSGVGVAAALAGCAGSDGGSQNQQVDGETTTEAQGDGGGGETTIEETKSAADLPPVHHMTDFANEAWQKKWERLQKQFTEETGIDIEMEFVGFSGGGQEQRLATLLQSGNPPDLTEGTMEQVADVWSDGYLAPTTEEVNKITETAGELTSDLFQDVNGDTFMFPHGYYTSVFNYREDIYEELGLEVPSSFAAMLDNARAIDESEFKARGYGLAGTKAGKSQDEFQSLLANMGVSELRIKDMHEDDPDTPPEAELWFPKEEMVTLLEYFQEIAQYSADPSSIGWGGSLKMWAGGRIAQQYHLNMWAGGVAASAGNDKVAKNTGLAPLPLWKEGGITKEKSWLSNPTPDGHFPYQQEKGAGNEPGSKRWMSWLYGENIERAAKMYETEPTRFFPIYGDIVKSDAFQSYDHWQEYPSHLEGLERISDDIVPNYYDNVEESLIVSTRVPERNYYYRFFFIGEMVNQVVVAGMDPEKAYEEAKEKAQKRLQEGKDRLR